MAGAFAAIAGSSPTGDATIDTLLVAITVAGVTWLGAAAMRWDAAMMTLAAGLLSWSILGTIVGVVAAVVGFVVRIQPGQRTIVNAVLIAIALNIAVRSDLGVFLGLSSIVFLVLAAYITIIGFTRRRKGTRQAAAVIVGTVVALAFVGTFAFGVFGYLAIDDVRAANQNARDGLSELGEGNTDAARASFIDAADRFEAAEARVASPLAAIARWVPGVAQHHRVATELAAGGAESTRLLADQLDQVDLDALSVSGGRIDVAKVRSLQSPLMAIRQQIDRLRLTIAELDSPWLLPPVADQIDELAADVAAQGQRSTDALTVANAAPALLGGDGPRTYFIGFTTPVEARGIGGFMGNWAEITVTDGQIALTRFGRSDDLNEAGDPTTRRFTTSETTTDPDREPGLDEWLLRYGAYHLTTGPDGTTGRAVWKNINMSPDMVATGRAIADLYPQSGGQQLDGVFMMDVYTLARLLEFTGPIALPDGRVVDGSNSVTADNAADFLLKGQYAVEARTERIDLLEEFSRSVIDALLAGSLPPPTGLLDTFGPMVDQGRFTGWMDRPDEQSVLDQIGMSGTLTHPERGDAVAIAFNNAAGSKIDYYLDANTRYTVTADAATSLASADLAVTLTNRAPAEGESDIVIGNIVGLPRGSNRTWVSIFTKMPVTAVTLDGVPVAIEIGREAGYFVTSAFVVLGAGETATLDVAFAGRLDVVDGYSVDLRTPPAVGPTPVEIDATWFDASGVAHEATHAERGPGVTTLTVSPDD